MPKYSKILYFNINKSKIDYQRIRNTMLDKSSEQVMVAIIDSGVNEKYVNECDNLIDFTSDNDILDKTGHGTIMYEIIHSSEWGIAPSSKVSILKVTAKNGKTDIEDVIEALKWCGQNSVNIISMSLSTSKNYESLHEELTQLSEMGIHIFASVSNSSCYVSYPAAYEEVIGVYAWRELPFFKENNYCYIPLNEYTVSETVSGNSAANALAVAVASYYLTDDNDVNKNVSNIELYEKILEVMNK